jgi:hypothetical protein
VIFASFHQGKEDIVFAPSLSLRRTKTRRGNPVSPVILLKKILLPLPLFYVILIAREKHPTGNHPQIPSGASAGPT